MDNKFVITIDGPAGAGKTTIAKMVARRVNSRYIDTGAMYRAVTLKVIRNQIPFSKVLRIEQLVEKTEIHIDFKGEAMHIYLDREDVTDEIRCMEVTENTSLTAAIPGVRYKLAKIQRETAGKLKKVVFEGRDMGSIVFPNADLKIYLDAGIEERAKRRWQELKDKGENVDLEELKKKIIKRDELDASRGLAPLIVPENSHIIDSTNMHIDKVVDKIIELLPV